MLPKSIKSKGLDTLYVDEQREFRFRAQFDTHTGYGVHACNIARSFSRFGYAVKGVPMVAVNGEWKDYSDVRALLLTGTEQVRNELILGFVHTKVEPDQWLYTMYETTRMPHASFVNVCAAQAVIVPSTWCRQCFDAQGIDRPMYVVPLGIDTSIFSPPKVQPKLCVFGAAGNVFLSGSERKNLEPIFTAFQEAFGNQQDVRLRIKIQDNCPVSNSDDPRIDIIRANISESEMVEWYRSLSAYVSISRSEAFGQMNLQAMACGVPVICCAHAGVTDYHNDTCGYNVGYDLVQAGVSYKNTGLWADPDIDSLIENMLRVYEYQKEAHEKGKLARLTAENYSWDNVNRILEQALSDSGFWDDSKKASKPVRVSRPAFISKPVPEFKLDEEESAPVSFSAPVSNKVRQPVVFIKADASVPEINLKSLWAGESTPVVKPMPFWLARRTAGHPPVFYMSGDFGDIIYALPTIRSLGGGTLCIGPARDHPYYWLREQMTPVRYAHLERLLAYQTDYLLRVFYADKMNGWNCHIDLNDSRRLFRDPYYKKDRNLADVPSTFFGCGSGLWREKWLKVDEVKHVAKLVFARSLRYPGKSFPWKKLVDRYKNDAVFVGLPEEHASFVSQFGNVKHYPTKDLFDVARVVAGAECFIGNQSCPLAIAEGLKVNCVREHFDDAPNCIFDRDGHTKNPDYLLC
jgi:glycosyltransferase involved in cell wall biosynthesis